MQQTILLTKEQHSHIEHASKTKLQAFQRKIYLKAKQNPGYKFYCLYDKVHREDVIREAFQRVKENNGAPGSDKQTFRDLEKTGKTEAFLADIRQSLIDQTFRSDKLREVQIPKGNGKMRTLKIPTIKDRVVQMAVKLTIEPIFEADFKEHSYGYRPKKSAHQALAKLSNALFPDIYRAERCQKEICSIDLSDCFDTIPHRELLQLIAQRIIDRKLLKLIKVIIEAGAIESPQAAGDDSNETGGGKGTPQGGVLSPLLANIYLDRLDAFWESKGTQSLMLRYADDMVVLLRREDEARYQAFLDYIETELKLTLNREKTIRRTRREGFDFLGFHIRQKTSRKQKQYLSIEPSRKALKRIGEKLRTAIRWNNPMSNAETISTANAILRGWHHYYDNVSMGKTRQRVIRLAENRLARFLAKRQKKRNTTHIWECYGKGKLYTEHGLYELKNLGRRFT